MPAIEMCPHFPECYCSAFCGKRFVRIDWQDCHLIPKEGEAMTLRKGGQENGVCVSCSRNKTCNWLSHCTEEGYYIVRCRMHNENGLPQKAKKP